VRLRGRRRNVLKPKLVYVAHSLDPGGTERLVVDMGVAFSAEYDVVICCLDRPGTWASDCRSVGVPVHCVWRQPGFDVAASMRLARFFDEVNADIVHAHQSTPWFYSALAKTRYSDFRLMFEEHGRFYPESKSRIRVLSNRLIPIRVTDRFVAVSEDIRRRLVRYEGIQSRAIQVIYNGVRESQSLSSEKRDNLRKSFGFKASDIVVGTVGRLDPIKNIPLLISSLRRACKTVPNIRGLIVGSGPLASAMTKLVEDLGLQEVITLAGYRQDAREVTACMDVFVLSSLSEGTSMALLEAMSAGVPVVATAVGGNIEIVSDGISGLLVPSGAETEMCDAIVELSTNSERAKAIGKSGKDCFLSRFTFHSMLSQYREIYRALT